MSRAHEMFHTVFGKCSDGTYRKARDILRAFAYPVNRNRYLRRRRRFVATKSPAPPLESRPMAESRGRT